MADDPHTPEPVGSETGTQASPSRLGDLPGRRIITLSWAGTGLFVVTALADQAGVEALEQPATFTALGLFGVGVIVWVVAFAVAVGRSREDEITLTGLFFLQGTAPRPVQVQLLGSLGVAVVVAGATAAAAPFGVMQPVYPLAMAGWWGARHGAFGPRRTPEAQGR